MSVHQLTKTTVFTAVLLYLVGWDTHVGKYPYGVSTLLADRRHCKTWSLFLLPPKKGQADCGYAIAGNGVLAVFSLLILLFDAKVRVNGTKQRALLINALRLDEHFCRLVQFCFPSWSDAVSTTSASEYDAIWISFFAHSRASWVGLSTQYIAVECRSWRDAKRLLLIAVMERKHAAYVSFHMDSRLSCPKNAGLWGISIGSLEAVACLHCATAGTDD